MIGSRYLHGVSVVNWPLHRFALSAAAYRYVRAITGAPVADCTSGFRCWRRDALGRIPLDRLVSNGYAFLIETLHEALRHGARIGEVSIVFVERRHGHSKVSLNVIAESLAMPCRIRFRPARAMSDPTIDVAVVGGGVVGLAAACAVAARGRTTCLIERLAHVVQNKVEAAYARSDLFERRRRLMDDWAAYLDEERGQVVQLRR